MEATSVKKIIMKYKFDYFKTLFMQTVSESMSIVLAFIFGLLIQGAANKDYNLLKISIILSFVILVFNPYLEYVYNVMIGRLNQKILYEIRQSILDKYMYSNVDEFRKTDNGSKLSVLTNDTDILNSDFLANIFIIWHYGFMLIATIISLICISVYMAAALIILTLISFYFSTKGVGDIDTVNEKRLKALSNHTDAMNEFLNGYDVIHDFKIQDHSHRTMKRLFENTISRYMDYKKLISKQQSIGMFFGGIVFMGGFIFGSALVYYSLLSIGMLITCIQLSNNLNQPIFNLVGLYAQFKASKNTIEKIDSILSKSTSEKNYRTNKDTTYVDGEKSSPHHRDLNEINNNVSYGEDRNLKIDILNSTDRIKDRSIGNYDLKLDEVSYSYPNSDFKLGPISDCVNFGKKICILGHSGSGKSTILKLLKKDIGYDDGNMYIGGDDYKSKGVEEILDYIGVIPQNVFVFKSSVKNNITLFDKSIGYEKIIDSMKKAGLDDFIEKMDDPNLIEELGGSISGGERQRISIARCLVRNKPIIVADEAFSSLDNNLAFEIESEMLNLKDNTFINITHRLFPKNLSKYDEIWILKKGKLIARGHYSNIENEEHLKEFIKNLK